MRCRGDFITKRDNAILTIAILLLILLFIGSMVMYAACIYDAEQDPLKEDSTVHITTTPHINTNHLYWKDIKVTVVDVEHTRRITGTATHRNTYITVYSEEYDLTFSSSYSGLNDLWDVEKGDIVIAELYTWKNDATGEINNRRINRVYTNQASREKYVE